MMVRTVAVPPFKTYFPDPGRMTGEQRAFYQAWRSAYVGGQPIGVDGHVSYLFVHAYEIIGRQDPDEVESGLRALIGTYRHETDFTSSAQGWLADALVLLNRYDEALAELPRPPIGSRWTTAAEDVLTVKAWLKRPIEGRDAVALIGPKLTRFGREHADLVTRRLDADLSALQAVESRDLIQEWRARARQGNYSVFTGTEFQRFTSHPWWYFSGHQEAVGFLVERLRTAENSVREERGLPHVGEGWVAETDLYYRLKARLSPEAVLQHARPAWLGRQHLDIFVPSRAVAIEYHGPQHDEPVAYFGGVDAFRRTQVRDRAKAQKCRDAGVDLLIVRPNYDLDEVIRWVIDHEVVD
jgi:hypothetical protein